MGDNAFNEYLPACLKGWLVFRGIKAVDALFFYIRYLQFSVFLGFTYNTGRRSAAVRQRLSVGIAGDVTLLEFNEQMFHLCLPWGEVRFAGCKTRDRAG
jgi:hypothetical protein